MKQFLQMIFSFFPLEKSVFGSSFAKKKIIIDDSLIQINLGL